MKCNWILYPGRPGRSKQFAAAVKKSLKKHVYHIDLSKVVSKYIGETEKNLDRVFRKAETKNWILFFDEADAIFGKRTRVRDAHDKYANQEVSYLLQRIEKFNGLVIIGVKKTLKIRHPFLKYAPLEITMPEPQGPCD